MFLQRRVFCRIMQSRSCNFVPAFDRNSFAIDRKTEKRSSAVKVRIIRKIQGFQLRSAIVRILFAGIVRNISKIGISGREVRSFVYRSQGSFAASVR
jgi:hypothetical protein